MGEVLEAPSNKLVFEIKLVRLGKAGHVVGQKGVKYKQPKPFVVSGNW